MEKDFNKFLEDLNLSRRAQRFFYNYCNHDITFEKIVALFELSNEEILEEILKIKNIGVAILDEINARKEDILEFDNEFVQHRRFVSTVLSDAKELMLKRQDESIKQRLKEQNELRVTLIHKKAREHEENLTDQQREDVKKGRMKLLKKIFDEKTNFN